MSTPLKALIQERLRAKMVRRGPDYDLDDEYTCDSDRLPRQPVEVTAYDINSREDDRVRSNSRGSTTRRNGSTQSTTRLHTHIDPSAYLVPSQQEVRYYPHSESYTSSSSSRGDHNRQRYSRYPREQSREPDAHNNSRPRPELQPQTHNRRRHHNHQRIREPQQPRYEASVRGGYVGRHTTQTRVVSPWHRPNLAEAPSKSSKSPISAAPSPKHSSTSRGYREQDFDYPDRFDGDDCMHRNCESKSATRLATPSSSTHDRQDLYQHHRYDWKDHNDDYGNQATYEVREPSPTRHHEYPELHEPPRCSSEDRKRTNQENIRRFSITKVPSPHKRELEEVYIPETTQTIREPEQQSLLALDMEIIEPPAKVYGRTRAWDDIMSPESRLAAGAFVEKRQRRSEKNTPRTMATQRWLEVIDARAGKRETVEHRVE